MKKENFIFAAVLAGTVAAAGTIIAVALKAKAKKEELKLKKDAAGVDPIEEEFYDEDEDDDAEFTINDNEEPVYVSDDSVTLDNSKETEEVAEEEASEESPETAEEVPTNPDDDTDILN